MKNNTMNPSTHVPGFRCPECKQFIPISIDKLLGNAPILCPACGLALHLDREESQESLAAIQKIADAIEHVKEVRTRWE